MTDLLWKPEYEEDFSWLRKCQTIRIEQQCQVNPPARCVALALSCSFRALRHAERVHPDVCFVSGNNKYKIVPLLFPDLPSLADRPTDRVGLKNKPIRKKMAVDDLTFLLEEYEQTEIQSLITSLHGLDQFHDIADAYLISLWKFAQPKKKTPKKPRSPKESNASKKPKAPKKPRSNASNASKASNTSKESEKASKPEKATRPRKPKKPKSLLK